ncbi:MAG: hypothetical protein WCY57_08645, partial [Micavibrio sp.]
MSASRPLKIATQSIVRNDSVLDEAVARLVIGMDGIIIFSNPACDALGGQILKGQDFLSIAAFEDEDDAFAQSPLIFAQDNAIFSALRSGAHAVQFTRTGERIALQFDSIAARDGARYVIASALADDEAFSHT